jgi:3-oxoacyl-[acyl-carrier protein] reductase
MNAELPLLNRCAVVTGAQQGIGRAIALALGRAGATIIANYLDDEQAAKELSLALVETGSTCHLVKADLSDRAGIDLLFERIDQIGPPEILVNNAAIFPRAGFLDLTEAMWAQTMAVNLNAPFLCTQLAAQRLVESGRAGSIVNITSGAAFRSSPRGAHYVSSKAGLVGLTKATALELAPHKIRVNAVAPGLTDTAQPRYGMTEQALRDAGQDIPLGGIAQPDDIAPVVRFLASDTASHVTGQVWHVNGGNYLG